MITYILIYLSIGLVLTFFYFLIEGMHDRGPDDAIAACCISVFWPIFIPFGVALIAGVIREYQYKKKR